MFLQTKQNFLRIGLVKRIGLFSRGIVWVSWRGQLFVTKCYFFRMEPSFVRIGLSMRIGPFSDGIASVLWCGQLVAPKCCVFQNGTEFRKNRTSHTY